MGASPAVKPLRSLAESAAAASLLAAGRWLPRRWVRAVGTLGGELAYRLDMKHTAVAVRNLESAFGDGMTPEERRAVTRACWHHYGRITADAAAFPKLGPEDIGTRIRYDDLHVLREAHDEGKGVLLISGHFGHWELTAYMQGFLGYPLLMITKPMTNRDIEVRLARLRAGSGNEVVAKENAVRASLRALVAGRGVAVMIDQDARDSGIFVPFFGRPSSTIPTVGTLHVRTGAAVVATFSYPEPDGGWRITYERLVFPALSGDRDTDVRRITEQTTALLEERIRERPELWLWMHRRWKTPPPDRASAPA